jgi:hypothetical protein
MVKLSLAVSAILVGSSAAWTSPMTMKTGTNAKANLKSSVIGSVHLQHIGKSNFVVDRQTVL